MIFYHGTTTAFNLNVGDYILPAIETGNLREDWRKKLNDKVFFTTSPYSAYKFARKAVNRYGGTSIVFIVKPSSDWYHVNTNEYIADRALITGVYNQQ